MTRSFAVSPEPPAEGSYHVVPTGSFRVLQRPVSPGQEQSFAVSG